MSIEAEFIKNTGNYEHVKLKISGANVVEFWREMQSFSDSMKEDLGLFQAELVSWVGPAYDKALNGPHDASVELVQRELEATVVSEETPKPAWTAPVEAKKKEWDDDWD